LTLEPFALDLESGVMTQKTISVPDISCGHCKTSIEGAVKNLKGVSKVEVDVDKKLVKVVFDPPEAIVAIVDAIEDQGYQIAKD
jgi:copper chaperone